MFRKDLIDLLLDRPRTMTELARALDEAPRDVEADVRHLLKSLKRSPYAVRIEPAACRQCGFAFDRETLRKPGKCPACRGTWVREATVALERTGTG